MASRQYYPPDAVEVTPSGVVIEFYDAVKGDKDAGIQGQRRHYLIRRAQGEPGHELPSVTTTLDVLDKPGLKDWAERIGVEGAIALAKMGSLPQSLEAARAQMAKHELRWWQTRDRASARGTLTHSDLVELMVSGTAPDLARYPREQEGFIRGACGWFADYRPQTVATERMVASLKHGYAGRFDIEARFDYLPDGFPGGYGLLDLKTVEHFKVDKTASKKAGHEVIFPPYLENVLQLEAYELARRECGYDPTDFRAVIRVDSTGAYDVTCSWVTAEDFLAVLACHRAVSEAKKGRGAPLPSRATALREAA